MGHLSMNVKKLIENPPTLTSLRSYCTPPYQEFGSIGAKIILKNVHLLMKNVVFV